MEFAVIDLETTGLFPNGVDRVVEIGVVRVDDRGNQISQFESLVNPKRDAGPTHIHGIEAWELNDAPAFEEIAGDVLAALDGAVLVAHNARFDSGFLNAELQRAGLHELRSEALCTMEVLYAVEPGAPRRLHDCCSYFGLPCGEAHRAIADAQMAAHLLVYLLSRWRYPALPDPVVFDIRPALSGRTSPRGSSKHITGRQHDYLVQLAARLPSGSPILSASAEGSQYLNLLDRVLEDRRLAEDEAELLMLAADTFKLGRDDVEVLHRHYLGHLIHLALADGVISPAERIDLGAVASILGLQTWPHFADALKPPQPSSPKVTNTQPADIPRKLSLTSFDTSPAALPTGTTVCFTGPMEHGGRDDMEHLARDHGLIVKSGVSGKVSVLVVGDPDTQSGKAQKARQLGTRIMSERAFLHLLGIE